MSVEESNKFVFPADNCGLMLRASPETLQRVGEARNYLFDLDDTIADYDQPFMQGLILETLYDHVGGRDPEVLEEQAAQLARHMHYGTAQKLLLQDHLDSNGIRTFWTDLTHRFGRDLEPGHVSFSPSVVKLIHFITRNCFDIGVISNSSETAGSRVLDFYEERHGVKLHDCAVFLGSSPLRKPSVEALGVYEAKTGKKVQSDRTAYIGNSISDLRFAHNIGAVGVLIDSSGVLPGTEFDEEDRHLLDDSLLLTDFGHLKNHIERVLPNYVRTIALSVDHGNPHDGTPTNLEAVSIPATDENIFQAITRAVEHITGQIPGILARFEKMYQGLNGRNVVKLPNYSTLFHNVTGSILIPSPDTIEKECYREYFQGNRFRAEGAHFFGRGPDYYKQMIPELVHDRARQNAITGREIKEAYDILIRSDDRPTTDEEYLLRLATMDNLRGNVGSLYLSTINIFREGREIPDVDTLLEVGMLARELYELTVELQYGFMLGLEIDQKEQLRSLTRLEELLATYNEYSQLNGYPLKFKTPEIENPLEIAIRAHEITQQYPETQMLVGLSSGGVELATVAQLLFKHNLGRRISTVHYPVSVHHGLSMWQKDKERLELDYATRDFLNLGSVNGKNVVICEDNANSGQTLTYVMDALNELGAHQTNFAVIEIDPTRILLHRVQQKIGAKHDIGQAATRDRPIANYFHPDFKGAVGVVKILLSDHSLNKIIAQDTANQYGSRA